MLDLTLQFDQRTYAAQAEILATMRLTNTGSQPELVNARLAFNSPGMPPVFREVHLAFTEATSPAPWVVMIRIGEPEDVDFKTLAPGQSAEHTYNLRQYYNLKPGHYTVQATYENEADPSTGSAWKGSLNSKPVSFELK